MAIVKLSKSKKGLVFIDDEGNVFTSSTSMVVSMIQGNLKGDFLLLSRMPCPVPKDKFKQSPVYDPDGTWKEQMKYAKTDDPMKINKNTDTPVKDVNVW
jgi:hypothetical protein